MSYIIIILSIIIMECILSIDNAVVLANMVKHLPKEQQKKALKYWIFWAYIFRWLLLFASVWILKILWFKLIWWLYLIYIWIKSFEKEEQEENISKKINKWFWMTVISVEIMDIIFSLDNIIWVVAFTSNIWIIITWVFIWILAMRFIAGYFIKIITKYPYLEISANIVIIILWFKLILSYLYPLLFETHIINIITSVITILLFIVPYFFIKEKWKF